MAPLLPIFHQIVGAICVLVGAVLFPLPIPLGLPLLVIGFALLAPYIPAFQRLVKHLRVKWPKFDATIRRYRDRMPPIIKKTIDKTHPDTV